MWSTLTGKIKHNTGGAEDTGRGEGRTGFLCAVRLSYIHLSHSPGNSLHSWNRQAVMLYQYSGTQSFRNWHFLDPTWVLFLICFVVVQHHHDCKTKHWHFPALCTNLSASFNTFGVSGIAVKSSIFALLHFSFLPKAIFPNVHWCRVHEVEQQKLNKFNFPSTITLNMF